MDPLKLKNEEELRRLLLITTTISAAGINVTNKGSTAGTEAYVTLYIDGIVI